MNRFSAFLLFGVATFACTTKTATSSVPVEAGAESPEPKDDAGVEAEREAGAYETHKDGVTLAITSVEAALEVGPVVPLPGQELVTVNVKLSNESAERPVMAVYPLFALITTESLRLGPDPVASSALAKSCPQEKTIGPGETIECGLVFDIKQGVAKDLRYKLTTGVTLSVNVPPIARCNALTQSGKRVTPTVGPVEPPPSVVPPPGTYVATSATVSSGTADSLDPWTIRISGTSVEQLVTVNKGRDANIDQYFTATTTALHAYPEKTSLTYTCFSPYHSEFLKAEEVVYGYDQASQTLFLYERVESGEALVVRFSKTN